MKGTQGVAIAVALGVVGAVCNWFYISRKAADLDKVEFVYVKADAKIRAGDKFKKEHFGKVEIPRRYAGNLMKVAVLWNDRGLAEQYPAPRAFDKNQLLLNSDLLTPAQKGVAELLGPDEISESVVVDSTTFVASNFNPGDRVLFSLPATRNMSSRKTAPTVQQAGPFRILRVGSRGGSRALTKARGARESRSNILTIPLNNKGGKPDKAAKDLRTLLDSAGGQGLRVNIVSAQKKDDPGP